MMDTIKQFFANILVEPAKRNLSSVLFWGGLFMVFVGAIFGGDIDSWKFSPQGSGEAILKGGSAILGAGVFAVIMKSAQFTSLFQKHIYDVFYDPDKIKEGAPLIEKWRLISNSLLKKVLPETHSDASNKIEQQFFNAELEYHFEEYKSSYDIVVDEAGKIAAITIFTNATIILSPHADQPTLKQSIKTAGGVELSALRMNDNDVLAQYPFVKDQEDEETYILSIPLKEHAEARRNNVEAIRLERVTKLTQDLRIEPYVKGIISRYIKGATISAKITDGYKIHFEKFGLGELPGNHHLADDGTGHERWVLVTPENLLLPGQGYILVISLEVE